MPENPYEGPNSGNDAAEQKKRRRSWIEWLVVIAIGFVLISLFVPIPRSTNHGGRRTLCQNNLRQIAIALRSYAEDHHGLPPAYTANADGKPLHSWRVLILPYLERSDVYNKIDFSKPWDHPANAEAYNTFVSVFRCPSIEDAPMTHTVYLASVAPNGCFRSTEPRSFSEITDNPSNTLMVVEVSSQQAVHWMAPNDADESMISETGTGPRPHAGGRNVAMCDGRVLFVPDDLSADDWRALISIAGGDRTVEELP